MNQENWYLVKQTDGTCDIVQASAKPPSSLHGACKSYEEAVVKRVGLIRAGKCKPQ